MGTRTYPTLHQLLRPVALDGAWRIYPEQYLDEPLGTGHGYSRFAAPSGEFTVLYAATTFETALREGLIRDRFDGRRKRRLAEHTLRRYASARIDTVMDLMLVDLTEGRASNHGIPSAIRHAADYTNSQKLALEVYQDMPSADGFLFRSRLDDALCTAVFDRAVLEKLTSPFRTTLSRNPLTRPALKKLRVTAFRWRGIADR